MMPQGVSFHISDMHLTLSSHSITFIDGGTFSILEDKGCFSCSISFEIEKILLAVECRASILGMSLLKLAISSNRLLFFDFSNAGEVSDLLLLVVLSTGRTSVELSFLEVEFEVPSLSISNEGTDGISAGANITSRLLNMSSICLALASRSKSLSVVFPPTDSLNKLFLLLLPFITTTILLYYI